MIDGSGRELSAGLDSATLDDNAASSASIRVVVAPEDGGSVALSHAEWVLRADFEHQGRDLLIEGRDGERLLVRDYFAHGHPASLMIDGEATLSGNLVSHLAGPAAPGQYAQNGTSDESAIGSVDKVGGEAWLTHADGTRIAVTDGTQIHMGDVVETAGGGTIAIAFVDGTSLSLGESARMVIDEMVYDPGGSDNSASISLVQGLFVLVSGDIAKTGEMTIDTPVSTIGIRGTSVAIQAAAEGLRNLITLLQDPDGNVGVVEVATQVARVILDTIGASTTVSSLTEPPTSVLVLSATDIENVFKSALGTMQQLRGSSLGITHGTEDNQPGNTNGGEEGANHGAPDAQDAQTFLGAVQDLIAALQNAGVDVEQIVNSEADELVAQTQQLVEQTTTELDNSSLPDKSRINETSGTTTSGGGNTTTSGNNGDLRFVNTNGESIGSNGHAQFGVSRSGALGTSMNATTGFLNTGHQAGFYFNPNGATNFGDPITSGSAASGYTLQYNTSIVDTPAATSAGGRNANLLNNFNATSLAEISDGSVVATSTGTNGALTITQSVTLAGGASYVTVAVLVENVSGGNLIGLRYLESINPNQDAVGASPTSATYNEVLAEPGSDGLAAVMATGPNSGVGFVLFADQNQINAQNDSLSEVSVGVEAAVSPTLTYENNPSQGYLYDTPDMGGTTADVAINLTFDIGTLTAGQEAYLSYVLTMNIASTLSDLLFATTSNSTVDGMAGNDTIIGSSGDDLLIGGTGNDRLVGGDGNDSLIGGTGNDSLVGGSGNDELSGGLGTDVVNGGDGNDQILWQGGDGSDVVDGGNGTDTLVVDTASSAADTVSLTQSGNGDLLVGVGGTLVVDATNVEEVRIFTEGGSDTVIVGSLSNTDVANSTVYIDLGDGNDTANAAIAARSTEMYGQAGDDTMIGSAQSDVIDGGSGNDSLYGNLGNDTLFGQDGNDSLQGSAGDDTLYGGTGNDVLDAGVGNDVIYGQDGNDVVVWQAGDTFGSSDGNDSVYGGNGDDVLRLMGYSGDDDFNVSVDSSLVSGLGGDTVVIDHDPSYATILAENIEVLDVQGGAGNNSLYVSDDLGQAGVFAISFTGGDGNDTLYGWNQSSSVGITATGGAGDDTLYGGSGDDTLMGGAGNDYIEGDPGNDQIDGGTGDDTIVWRNGDGNDQIDGGAGSDTLSVNDTFTLTGGLIGSDGLSATLSNGDGVQILQTFSNDGNAVIAIENVETVQFYGNDGDNRFVVDDLSDTPITSVEAHMGGGNDIFDATASGIGVTAYGGSDADTLLGGSGDDSLFGDSGNDVIDGGSGDNRIEGGDGSDQITYAVGGGSDSIDGGDGSDTLLVLASDGGGQISIYDDGEGAVVIDDGENQTSVVAVETMSILGGSGADFVTIGDLSGTDVLNESITFMGGGDNDFLYGVGAERHIYADGGDGNDTLVGGSQNDVLHGGSGDDTLVGNGGDDAIYGEAGNDLITWSAYAAATFGASDGSDYVDGGDNTDTLSLAGTGSSDTFELGSGVLEIHNLDQIQISHDLSGALLTVSNVEIVSLSTSAGDDTVYVANDLHNGGVDQLIVDTGSGNDHVDASALGAGATLVATMGSGNDTVEGGAGADTLYGGSNNDLLTGNGGNDQVFGESGNDHIVWNDDDGSDTIDGGSGTDTLTVQTSTTIAASMSATLSAGGGGNAMLEIPSGSSNDMLTVSGVETVQVLGDSGDDRLVINDLTGTDVGVVTAALGDGNDTIVWHPGGGTSYLDGGSGTDTLSVYGSTGDDTISVSQDISHNVEITVGDETILASNIEELQIVGNGGNDDIQVGDLSGTTILNSTVSFTGGSGDDRFDASLAGKRIVADGGAGDDTLIGGTENDQLTGGIGDDSLVGGHGSDLLSGGDGNDTFSWEAERIVGTVTASDGNNSVDGGDGDDVLVLHGSGGNDTFVLDGTGSSHIHPNGDRIDFSNLETISIEGSAGSDSVTLDGTLGGSGLTDVVVDGGGGNDYVDLTGSDLRLDATGGSGNDTLVGGEANDILRGGSDNDVLTGHGGVDQIFGKSGNDTINWYDDNGSDTVDGGTGDDTLLVGKTEPVLDLHVAVAGMTTSLTAGEGGNALIEVSSGSLDDMLTVTGVESVVVAGDDGNDIVVVGALGDTDVTRVTGDLGGGHDIFDGSTTDAVVWVDGGSGSDTLQGGSATDTLYGGSGDDVLVWDVGGGSDFDRRRRRHRCAEPAGQLRQRHDRHLAEPLRRRHRRLRQRHPDRLQRRGDRFQRRSRRRQSHASAISTGRRSSNSTISFTGGQGNDVFDGSSAGRRIVADGGADNDTITGGDQNNSLAGGDGQDTLNGGAGEDTLHGDAGNDQINAGSDNTTTIMWTVGDGSDTIDGGTGFDTLSIDGTSGNDVIDISQDGFGSGNVIIVSGDDTVTASNVDEIVIATGTGDDLVTIGDLSGTAVLNSTISFSGGFGDDTLDASEATQRIYADGGDNNDTLEGGSASDTLLGGSGNDSLVGGHGSDQLVGGTGDDTFSWDAERTVGTVTASDGNNSVDGGDGNDMLVLHGTGGNDTFDLDGTGTSHVDPNGDRIDFSNLETISIVGSAGNDIVEIAGSLDGSSLTDVIVSGGSGNDYVNLSGADANLRLDATGDSGNDQLYGGAANDTLSGGSDNDLLSGGGGADTVDGGSGDDRILWNQGDGADTIDGGTGNDRLETTGNGTISATQDGSGHILVSIGAETATVSNVEVLAISGQSGDDAIDASMAGTRVTLSGQAGNDILTGGVGNDVLNGGDGDDVLTGGAGYDRIFGDDGNDTVIWNVGDGSDTADGGADTDTLSLVGTSGSDTIDISQDGNGNIVVVSGDDTLTASHFEEIVISGGGGDDHVTIGNISGTTILNNTVSYTGGAGNDVVDGSLAGRSLVLDGGSGNDTLTGGNQNDMLTGGDGNDTLNAAYGGNDTLTGGAGNDHAVLYTDVGKGSFDGGDGYDTATVMGTSGNDVIIAAHDSDTSGHVATEFDFGQSAIIADNGGGDMVLLNDGNGNFFDSGQSFGPNYASDVGVADLNGDGHLDAFVSGWDENPHVLLNDGNGNFTDVPQVLGPYETHRIALGDLNGDGFTDVFAANAYGSGTFGQGDRVFFNDGSGGFYDSGQNLGNGESYGVALDDVDGDGKLDAVVVGSYGSITVWINDGTGHFTDNGQSITAYSATAVALGDLNGDHVPDAFITSDGGYDQVWFNDGAGHFTDSGQSLAGSASYDVALGDLNGDGLTDAFIATGGYGGNQVWLNDGCGHLVDSGQNLYQPYSYSVALADVNGDGSLDAVVAGDTVKIWFNDGNGNFYDSGQLFGNGDGTGVALGDFDGSGATPPFTLDNVEAVVLDGGNGDDYLDGGTGVSTLLGGAGDDTMTGGFGVVMADGGAGNDQMQVNLHSGLIALTDSGTSSGDNLDFTDWTDPTDLVFNRLGNGVLTIDAAQWVHDSAVEIQIADFEDANGQISDNSIDSVSFHGGGQVWFEETGTEGNDLIVAQPTMGSGATIDAGDGNDVVFGSQADGVTLLGGYGDDWIVLSKSGFADGGNGNDHLVGSTYDDTLYGGSGFGNDTLSNGGGGNDYLSVSDGDNVFYVSALDSNPFSMVINDDSYGNDLVVFDGSFQLHDIVDNGSSVAFSDEREDIANLQGSGFGHVQFDELNGIGYFGDALYDYQGGRTSGGSGNDFLFATGADNGTLDGGSGNDFVWADRTYSHDTIGGGAGNDVMGGGNASIAHTFVGGGGFDIVSYRNIDTGVTVNLADGTATRDGVITDTLVAIAGILGGDGSDFLTGNGDANLLSGGGGDDNMVGGAGNDVYVLNPGNGVDTISDSSGNDLLVIDDHSSQPVAPSDLDAYQSGNDLMITDDNGNSVVLVDHFNGQAIERIDFSQGGGTYDITTAASAGNDFIAGSDANDTVDGGDGNDALFGHLGNDLIHGGAGDDFINGGAGNDTLWGDDGNDSLVGGAGNDLLMGGAGNDTLSGGSGDDTMQGGSGDDTYHLGVANGAHDVISDSSGTDVVDFHDDGASLGDATVRSGSDLVLQVDLGGDSQTVTLSGQYAGQAIEVLAIDNNVFHLAQGMTGGDFADLIAGGSANDVIDGGRGADALFGGGGNDTLTGGAANDVMVGGSGSDTFAYHSLDDVLHVNVDQSLSDVFNNGDVPGDQIRDFQSGTDHLSFEGADFSGVPTGTVDSDHFRTISGSFDGTNAGFTNGATSGFVYSQDDHALYFDDNSNAPGYYAVALVDQPSGGDIQVANNAPP